MKRGEQRGRYTIEHVLGRGGMASVYLACDEELGRRVALKVPAEDLADDETFRARFLREARLASRIVHPNVVQVYDAGEDEHGLYIVLEYVEGETLAEELARRGRLPASEVAELGTAISSALDAAHAAGLVHRDVKPQNIMRAADGETKLGDFGIARASDSTVVTEHGTVLGTAAYLAPEQARGERVTAAADLYALGVVLYEALTGRLPHEGESLPELLLKRERDAPTPVRAHAPDAPTELEGAITQSLAREPEDRPRSAAELGRRLALALPGAATHALPASGVAATRVLAPADGRTALTRLLPATSPRIRAVALPVALLLAVVALALAAWASGDDTLALPTTAASPPPPPPQVSHPPPVALPPPTPAPPACPSGEGNDKGKGKGNGKGKGHEKQRERLQRACEEAADEDGDDDDDDD
ncbi:MAG TPA: serine/threonine-protein kinase [Gaiellaceae bacterium]|nr:serine/threonine-protein kinase [Gaiellaceae bacterium]